MINLLKRMPAFTKIYRENQLLKHERNLEKNNSRSPNKSAMHATNFNSFSSNHTVPINIKDYVYT
jgi:hypothetical protein